MINICYFSIWFPVKPLQPDSKPVILCKQWWYKNNFDVNTCIIILRMYCTVISDSARNREREYKECPSHTGSVMLVAWYNRPPEVYWKELAISGQWVMLDPSAMLIIYHMQTKFRLVL